METTFKQCPKCGHPRRPEETAAPEQCPACGIYFAKWVDRDKFVPPSLLKRDADAEDDDEPRWRDHIIDRILHVPKKVSGAAIWGRAATLVFLLVWGIRMARMDYRDGEIGRSFMHNILLPIHEAGHMLFMPFGEFGVAYRSQVYGVWVHHLGVVLMLLSLAAAAAVLWRWQKAHAAARAEMGTDTMLS